MIQAQNETPEDTPDTEEQATASQADSEADAGTDADAENQLPTHDIDRPSAIAVLEAALFAASEPLKVSQLANFLHGSVYDGDDKVAELLEELANIYANRGVNLENHDSTWALRTNPDIARYLVVHKQERKKLSRAAMETLAIIAYHQPISRAEIEEIRGVALSKGTLDTLLEAEWIVPKGRRQTPGRPLTWGTSDHFLDHFQLSSLGDLPGVEELRSAGLLDSRSTLNSTGISTATDGIDVSNPLDDVDVEGIGEVGDVRGDVRGANNSDDVVVPLDPDLR